MKHFAAKATKSYSQAGSKKTIIVHATSGSVSKTVKASNRPK